MFLWPFVVLFYLGKFARSLWLHYVQQDFISGIEWVILEIIPPREVERSPKAMELFFTNALYHFSNKGGLEAWWVGAVWFYYSLEIVSIEGTVHFYIRVPSRLKEFVETNMYAQYPQAQIKVVDDYTLAVDEISDKSSWNLWGCEFALEKPEAYPIKTYTDFGLDKDPKEEFKVDPISPVVELFASVAKGEQMWVQIVVRPSKKEFHGKGEVHDWVKESQDELERLFEKYGRMNVIEGEEKLQKVRPPFTMEPIMRGINEKTMKLGFDTGIRVCYVAKKEAWSMNSRRNIRMIFRQYAKPNSNSLVRVNSTQADALGGPLFPGWFPLSTKNVQILANRMLMEYRERSFFYHPLRQKILHHLPWPFSPYLMPAYFHSSYFVLNVEELATLWHFPGQILKVPTFERIESKEAAPPTNLPV
ncbi:hypothetical protein K8Q94_00710 [Candidatus Nomurabacteria bacterium]|nr:hypothetical protein [Candidatus Nomurabacteria bacterium]